jgi:hypothetical protein
MRGRNSSERSKGVGLWNIDVVSTSTSSGDCRFAKAGQNTAPVTWLIPLSVPTFDAA